MDVSWDSVQARNPAQIWRILVSDVDWSVVGKVTTDATREEERIAAGADRCRGKVDGGLAFRDDPVGESLPVVPPTRVVVAREEARSVVDVERGASIWHLVPFAAVHGEVVDRRKGTS